MWFVDLAFEQYKVIWFIQVYFKNIIIYTITWVSCGSVSIVIPLSSAQWGKHFLIVTSLLAHIARCGIGKAIFHVLSPSTLLQKKIQDCVKLRVWRRLFLAGFFCQRWVFQIVFQMFEDYYCINLSKHGPWRMLVATIHCIESNQIYANWACLGCQHRFVADYSDTTLPCMNSFNGRAWYCVSCLHWWNRCYEY